MIRTIKSGRIWPFVFLYLLTYMGNAVYNTFMPVYLNQKGFGNSAVGVLLAVGPFVAIAAQPFWGTAADRARSKSSVLRLLLLGSAVSVMLFSLSNNFLYLFAVTALFAGFQTSVTPLSDAVTLEYLETASFPFGRIRLAGTIGFAAMSVVAGMVADRYINGIFPLYFLLSLLALLSAFRLPGGSGPRQGRKKASLPAVFQNRHLVLLLMLSLIVQTTLGCYYSFFPIYFKQLGANSSMLGWSMLISSLSEIPFLLFADKILHRFGVKGTLLASSLLMAVRWMLFFAVTDPKILLIVQVLHGANFIVFAYSLAVYINRQMPPELKASGQAVSGIVTFGLSRIAGSLLGGVFSSAFGIRRMFFCNAWIVLAATFLFGFIFLKMKGRPAAGHIPN